MKRQVTDLISGVVIILLIVIIIGAVGSFFANRDNDEECNNHDLRVMQFPGENSTTVNYFCSDCGETLYDSKSFSSSVTYYSDVTNVVYTRNSLVRETLEPNFSQKAIYTTSEGRDDGVDVETTIKSSEVTPSQYLVVKYRVRNGEWGRLQFTLKLNGSKVLDSIIYEPDTDGWVVAVVNIFENPAFKTAAIHGNASLEAVFSHKPTLDFAYIAMAEDLAGVRSLLNDGETYFDRADDFGNVSGTEVSKDGVCAVKHTLVVQKKLNMDGTTTYRYVCSTCQHDLAESKTFNSSLAYVDGSSFVKKGNQISVFQDLVENGVPYKHIESLTAGGSSAYSEAMVTGITLGKYLAVKYRVTDAANNGNVKFELRFNNDTAVHTAEIVNAKTDGWVVAVVDISNKSQYKAQVNAGTTINQRFWFRILNGATIDISYAVMSDDLSVIQSFLEEGESYFYRGENLQDTPGDEVFTIYP